MSSPAPSRWSRVRLLLACSLWLDLGIAVAVKVCLEPVLHSAYPCFEAGSRCWWNGQDLYSIVVCGHEYRYAPAIAAAMVPLALLPTTLGSVLWYWLNIAAYFWSLWALMRWVLPGEWTPGRKAVFLTLVFLASVRMIWAAQSNALIFAMVAGAAVAVRRGRWWTAALLLAVPVHVKLWPLAAALLLIACWPRKLAMRFAVALAAVGAFPFLTKPATWVCQQYAAWFSMLFDRAQVRHVYRDAWTIWELIYPPVDARAYLVLQLAAAAAVLLLCWRYSRRHNALKPDALARETLKPDALARETLKPDALAREALKPDALAREALKPDALAREGSNASLASASGFNHGFVGASGFDAAAQNPGSTDGTRRVPAATTLTLILALWAAWQLTFGPGTERNTFGLIAPLTAWGLVTSLVEKRGRALMIAAFALTTLANFGVVERALDNALPAVLAMHPVGILLFVVWLLTGSFMVGFTPDVQARDKRAVFPRLRVGLHGRTMHTHTHADAPARELSASVQRHADAARRDA